MDSLALLWGILLSPPVICFGIGILAVWVKSDLSFPEQVYQAAKDLGLKVEKEFDASLYHYGLILAKSR